MQILDNTDHWCNSKTFLLRGALSVGEHDEIGREPSVAWIRSISVAPTMKGSQHTCRNTSDAEASMDVEVNAQGS